MKDKRNCSNNMNYPIYQQPMMVPPMGYPIGFQNTMMGMGGMPNMTGMTGGVTTNTIEQQLSNLEQQINLLDQRVTRLEKLNSNTTTNNYNKYNDSNYYMV